MKRLLAFLILFLGAIAVLIPIKAELKTGEIKPVIHFSEPAFDFGWVYQGDEVTHAFKFQNVGNEVLRINRVRAACGCSKAKAFPDEIAPGEFGRIEVTFNTLGYVGKQTKTVSVFSNDPLNSTVQLKLKGQVKEEIKITPSSLSFGDVSKHTRVTRQIEIIQLGEQELILNKVTTDKDYLKIDSVERKEGRDNKSVYVITVALTGKAPVGYIVGRIEVNTNLKRRKKILIHAQGKISGDIKLSPERVLFTVPAGTERTFPVIVYTTGDDFEILKIESKKKHISAKFVTLEKFKKYRIDFEIAKEAPPGPVMGNVKIYTNCPQEDTLEIPVMGTIIEEAIEIGSFFERGCLACEHAHRALEDFKITFPNIIVKEYDIELRENMELNETLCEIYGVPEEKRMATPALFIGSDFLIGESVTKEKMFALINKYKEGASLPLQEATEKRDVVEDSIITRFRSFGIFAIIGAGLLDGVNPCAFATMIFLISYLAIAKRKGKELILVGTAFSVAVFITYLLIGIGLFEFLNYFAFLKTLTKFIYGVIALLTFILGILSLIDYFKCRKGQAKDIFLQLPDFLKEKIHLTIKEHAGLKRYVFAAFVTGFIVSILELSCTGQVYLPTIVYATGISKVRFSAYAYLLLYNLMFILPLIVIFVLVYFGTTSIRLGDALSKNIAIIKLSTSILFFIFTAFLIIMLIVPV